MIIAVAGADGAGKTTVARAVEDVAREAGVVLREVDRWDAVADREGPARFVEPDVRLLSACLAEMPTTSRFLFLTWALQLSVTRPRHEPGAAVLLDGYWMKHAAAEVVYGTDRRWAETVVQALPPADLVLYLRVDPEVAWERKAGRDVVPYECGMDPACARDSFVRHQRGVGALLDEWSVEHGWTTIDADAPREQVVEAAVTVVRPALEERAGSAAVGS